MREHWAALVQLQCGHNATTVVVPPSVVPKERLHCDECQGEVKIHAVECREWRARCHHCRYSRYFGASHDNAANAQANHTNKYGGHYVTVLYMLEPKKFQDLKRKYGRAVRNRIEGKPNIPYPDIRKPDDGTIPF